VILSDFAGAWQMDRRIDDRMTGRIGTVTGIAVFHRSRDGLLYQEEGILRLPGQPDLTARQSYLWRADGDGIEVRFADGRSFHRFALGRPTATARHDCAPDTYAVTYDLAQWPDWASTWNVTGPRKDYAMITRYRRSDATGPGGA
jgi:hypothetical protein